MTRRQPVAGAGSPAGADPADPGPCAGDTCVTCSDSAVPVRVRTLLGDGLALVDTDAGPEEVSVALVDAHPGDVVLVHAKEAIAAWAATGDPAAWAATGDPAAWAATGDPAAWAATGDPAAPATAGDIAAVEETP